MRSKFLEHSKTNSSYKDENCDTHNNQRKYCLRIIYTWKKRGKKLQHSFEKKVLKQTLNLAVSESKPINTYDKETIAEYRFFKTLDNSKQLSFPFL